MPLAHICPVCGTQLARIRAVPDAVYGLPLVVCSCGHAVVRRKHPLTNQFRRIRSAIRAVILLLLHLAFLALLSLANGGFIASLQKSIADMRLTSGNFLIRLFNPAGRTSPLQSWLDHEAGYIFLIGFALTAFFSGIWLRAALAHWRWPLPILAWGAMVSFWIWMEALIWPLEWLGSIVTGDRMRYTGPGIAASIECAKVLAAALLVSLSASPVGKLVSRSFAASRRRRFIKSLNKRRKARRGE